MSSSSLQKHLLNIQSKAQLAAARVTDQHIRLAVTGLSGAGKTAFITSLVNQLLEANNSAHLPFFSLCRDNRFVGAKREVQPDLRLARFEYEQGMTRLDADPPTWPKPTNGISQIRLKIKYEHRHPIRRLITEQGVLVLDIVDYPGEWLLDLPMLNMDFGQWSQFVASQWLSGERQELAAPFLSELGKLDWLAQGDEMALKALAEQFSEYLHACKAKGLELVQPGRFLLPGELQGAPILQFIPMPEMPEDMDWDTVPEGSNLAIVKHRYQQYLEQVVKPFYKAYFKDVDRQVVLVDCLSALNSGQQSLEELQQAINWLLKSFDYGSNSILHRLFSPKIDKLVFAASKADHITPDQHHNLVRLLESMVHQARQEISYQGIQIQTTAMAAIRASVPGSVQHDGEALNVLKGRGEDGQPLTLYPGDVPASKPPSRFWQQQGFEFPRFAPPIRSPLSALPHIRMDQMLEFLLGDKML
ncbi:YcjX family protein [Aliiglaciecola sp. CAU 1673]|uniref:YcjX family protein n=1 Tax=Aliiglaciecola sp. CAU 1673 TaxID=3032595 RepID=UPI0023DC8D45|nr:YcjX family protein [Aliiglaciecola sp. CAU 1673]MDF2179580.1 YcjX family protein [Aliiglaciecola sp. CAU 1673]